MLLILLLLLLAGRAGAQTPIPVPTSSAPISAASVVTPMANPTPSAAPTPLIQLTLLASVNGGPVTPGPVNIGTSDQVVFSVGGPQQIDPNTGIISYPLPASIAAAFPSTFVITVKGSGSAVVNLALPGSQHQAWVPGAAGEWLIWIDPSQMPGVYSPPLTVRAQ